MLTIQSVNEQKSANIYPMDVNTMCEMHDAAEFLAPTKKMRRLSVLLAIEHNSSISQHTIGTLTCMSSAMVNHYIKQLQREQLITVQGENNRTQTYHLTANGKREMRTLLKQYAAELATLCGNAPIVEGLNIKRQ